MLFLLQTFLNLLIFEAQPSTPPSPFPFPPFPLPTSPFMSPTVIMKRNTLGDFCLPKDKLFAQNSQMEDKNLFLKHMKLIQSYENLKQHCDDQNSEIFSLKMKVNELQKLIPSTVSLRPPSYAQIFKNSSPKNLPRKSPILPKLHSSQSNFLPRFIRSRPYSENPKPHFTSLPVSMSKTSSSFPSPIPTPISSKDSPTSKKTPLTKQPSPSVTRSQKHDFLPSFVQSPISSLTSSSIPSPVNQVWQYQIRILKK